MTVAPHPAEVRNIILRTFSEYGVDAESARDLEENLMIEQGKCVARSYRAGDLFAMWMMSVGILQFYDAQGNMLRTINLLQHQGERRMAA